MTRLCVEILTDALRRAAYPRRHIPLRQAYGSRRGEEMRIVAFITEPKQIDRILDHLKPRPRLAGMSLRATCGSEQIDKVGALCSEVASATVLWPSREFTRGQRQALVKVDRSPRHCARQGDAGG